MKKGFLGSLAVLLALGAAGCGSLFGGDKPKHAGPAEPPWHPPTAMLVVYAAPDGSLTRAQMEAGLRRDFAKADTHHNGCLDEDQVRAINQQRWKDDESTASPLIDFKHNGCVDFDEYAATPRSLFDMLDRDGKGKLTPQQLGKPGPKKASGDSAPPA
jgi:hypothetical protein